MSARSLLWILAGSIFVSELIAMAMLHTLLEHSSWGEALADSTLLLILISPALYFTLVRPLAVLSAERERAVTELRESEAHYRAITRSANDAIVTGDGAGNIVDFNLGAEQMFGRTEADVRGQPLTLLMPPRYHDLHRNGLKRMQASGELHITGKTVPLEGLRKDGSEFSIELSLADWSTTRGRFFTAIVRDITARRQAEAHREKLIPELQEALADVKSLSGLLPICAGCKKIRDDEGYWNQVEVYIGQHTDARFTHGLCPECITKYHPDLGEYDPSSR